MTAVPPRGCQLALQPGSAATAQTTRTPCGEDTAAAAGPAAEPATDRKIVKTRVHLDITTAAEDRDQEIERLLALGARRADIGQTGAESWTVLADPEGNEFCVIRPKQTLIS